VCGDLIKAKVKVNGLDIRLTGVDHARVDKDLPT
jgi:hypothetical protein